MLDKKAQVTSMLFPCCRWLLERYWTGSRGQQERRHAKTSTRRHQPLQCRPAPKTAAPGRPSAKGAAETLSSAPTPESFVSQHRQRRNKHNKKHLKKEKTNHRDRSVVLPRDDRKGRVSVCLLSIAAHTKKDEWWIDQLALVAAPKDPSEAGTRHHQGRLGRQRTERLWRRSGSFPTRTAPFETAAQSFVPHPTGLVHHPHYRNQPQPLNHGARHVHSPNTLSPHAQKTPETLQKLPNNHTGLKLCSGTSSSCRTAVKAASSSIVQPHLLNGRGR